MQKTASSLSTLWKTKATAVDQARNSFLFRLPLEIRLEIYSYLVQPGQGCSGSTNALLPNLSKLLLPVHLAIVITLTAASSKPDRNTLFNDRADKLMRRPLISRTMLHHILRSSSPSLEI
jgi:hypothetical protein